MRRLLPLILAILSSSGADRLTIYPNKAFVTELKEVHGKVIDSLPATLDPLSLSVRCENSFYRYTDRKSLREALKALLKEGDEVQFLVGSGEKVERGVVRSVDPLIIEGKGRVFFNVNYLNLIFDRLPPEFSLKKRIELSEPHKSCEISYSMGGIRWESVYRLTLGQKRLGIKGSIQITNTTDYPFKRVKIGVVAGEGPNDEVIRGDGMKAISPQRRWAKSVAPAVEERGVAGFHHYAISGRWDLHPKEQLSIGYIDESVDYRWKIVTICNDLAYNSGTRRYRFNRTLTFRAPKPLPGGVATIYGDIPLGESYLPPSAQGEEVLLPLGKDFDLLLERRILFRQSDRHTLDLKVLYSISNGKGEGVETEVIEYLPYGQCTISTTQDYRHLDAQRVGFRSKVPPHSTIKFEVEYNCSRLKGKWRRN
ncbi:MAG: hypothetical protein GXO19_04790 [Epsilonproteobacteria bacterium]|nr:hypothetical protein [Campylobacterota bacterium]NPA57036.1 hypothetical protein [Campylobacterota bacterium]